MGFMKNKILDLFKIEIPIIQAGMVWCSGWKLASAVSNAGGLGVIGAGSMYPAILREHIQKYQRASTKPFAVNVPLLYPNVEELIEILIKEDVPIVFTSAGNPLVWTHTLKAAGIVVVHVVSSAKFAVKAKQAGVDAIVAEGFEAGGHNGREETTTMVLLPLIKQTVDLPLIAAGGIACARSMLAAEVLGADAVQIGSRFAVSEESSAHQNYKRKVVDSGEGDTAVTLKEITPVRLLKNKFYDEVRAAELRGASKQELEMLLGKRRARKGIFEGDLDEGELEIGQVSAQLKTIMPAGDIVREIWLEYQMIKKNLCYEISGD
jgi:enoyl-[acyl-carrier protein] reductase II